jgi:hypothetical protein
LWQNYDWAMTDLKFLKNRPLKNCTLSTGGDQPNFYKVFFPKKIFVGPLPTYVLVLVLRFLWFYLATAVSHQEAFKQEVCSVQKQFWIFAKLIKKFLNIKMTSEFSSEVNCHRSRTARVTRLDEFSPKWVIVLLGQLFWIFWDNFFHS